MFQVHTSLSSRLVLDILCVWITVLVFDFSISICVRVWPASCRCLDRPRVPVLTLVTDWQDRRRHNDASYVHPPRNLLAWPGKSWESLTFKAGRLRERKTEGSGRHKGQCPYCAPWHTNPSQNRFQRAWRTRARGQGATRQPRGGGDVAAVIRRGHRWHRWYGGYGRVRVWVCVCMSGTRRLIDRSHQRQPNDTPNHQLGLIKVPNWMSLINNVCPQ